MELKIGDIVLLRHRNDKAEETGTIYDFNGYHRYMVLLSNKNTEHPYNIEATQGDNIFSNWKIIAKLNGGGSNRRRKTNRKLNKKKKSVRRKRHY